MLGLPFYSVLFGIASASVVVAFPEFISKRFPIGPYGPLLVV